MAREICKLSLTVVDTGETIDATGSVSFNGGVKDTVCTLTHIFKILQLDATRARVFSLLASDELGDVEEDGELDGCGE